MKIQVNVWIYIYCLLPHALYSIKAGRSEIKDWNETIGLTCKSIFTSGSSGTATAMKGILHNNVFEENVKKISLHLEGRTSSPYQQITMYQNYITRSDVDHEPVILFYQVSIYFIYSWHGGMILI